MEIHLAKPGGEREGPYSPQQITQDIKNGKYGDGDYWAWYKGLPEWMPLYKVLTLVEAAAPKAPPPPSKKPEPIATVSNSWAIASSAPVQTTFAEETQLFTADATASAVAVAEPEKAVAEETTVIAQPQEVSAAAPVVVEEAPVRIEEALTPVEEAPVPVEEAPAPVVEAPAPIAEEPSPLEEAPASVEETPASVEETPASVEETPVLVEEEAPAPVKAVTAVAEVAPTVAEVAPICAEPKPSFTPADRRASSGMAFSALEQVFVFTTGDGPAFWGSEIAARIVCDVTGEELSRLRRSVPKDVIFGCDAMGLLGQEGTISESVWRSMEVRQPVLVEQARRKLYRICVRTFRIEADTIITLVLFYNKQKVEAQS